MLALEVLEGQGERLAGQAGGGVPRHPLSWHVIQLTEAQTTHIRIA